MPASSNIGQVTDLPEPNVPGPMSISFKKAKPEKISNYQVCQASDLFGCCDVEESMFYVFISSSYSVLTSVIINCV